ncbi:MAG: hypothetical protein ACFBSC_15220 [Microcoleaceae cyanobacterium]
MTFAVIYGILSLKQAFAAPNLIQDDARQHVFWMQRFIDPELFPGDLIADYFQAVAPAGYAAVYQLAAALGIHPLIFCRIAPPILGLISTGYFFFFCLEILPIPITSFFGSLILNQVIWLKDDVASGTPRAFIYPIFISFLYYLLRGATLGVVVTIGLIGLFYPQYVFIAAGILILRLLSQFSFGPLKSDSRLDQQDNHQQTKIFIFGLVTAILILLPYALNTSEFGPAINREQAMQSLEFFPNGRSMFFHADPADFWLTGRRSGMFPKSLLTPATQCAGLFLPLLLILRPVFPKTLTSVQQISPKVWILPQLLISAVVMFFLSHAFLFKLHLPSLYTGLSFRIILTAATAISLTILINSLFKLRENKLTVKSVKSIKFIVSSIGILALTITIIFYPSFVPFFPLVEYRQGKMTELYDFFQQQPKDTMIASLSGEVNQLPTFAKRSILMGREYMIPYQLGYYNQMYQRTVDLLKAHYDPDLSVLKDLIQTYEINFFLTEMSAFSPQFFENNDWILEFTDGQTGLTQLQAGEIPALAWATNRCIVFQFQQFLVADADCILKLEPQQFEINRR